MYELHFRLDSTIMGRFTYSILCILFHNIIFCNIVLTNSNDNCPFRTLTFEKNTEISENSRFLVPLSTQKLNKHTSEKKEITRFMHAIKNQNLNYDYNRDQSVDKTDLFIMATQWPYMGSIIRSFTQLDWSSNRGIWERTDETLTGITDLDARFIAQESFPIGMDFTATLSLHEGVSAGLLFWAEASGELGYTIRLDSTLNALVLSKIGPWPEEYRLDLFPWSIIDGSSIKLKVVTTAYGIQVFCPEKSKFPILEALNETPLGNHLGFYLNDARASFRIDTIQPTNVIMTQPSVPVEGDYFHIYDQSDENEWWYINDHCFIQGSDGLWHLFGITHPYPPEPADENQFAHAISNSLTQTPWIKKHFALTANPDAGESHLWAPHVVEKDGLYYMFYTAGSLLSNYRYRIHLAFSSDLLSWSRYTENPLFQDYFDARDPMVIQADDQYIMYYTALDDRPTGNHIIVYRTSDDLLNWSPRHTAFIHEATGTYNGPTESPYVTQKDNHFYLFTGPDGDYRRTAVYGSSTPYHWDRSDLVTHVNSHAAEVIQDNDGSWYVSHCGWYYDGVYLSPLTWVEEPSVIFFGDLGENLDCISESEMTFVSDWRGTSALDIAADYNGYFILEIPVRLTNNQIILEFEEQGEVLLEALTQEQTFTLLNEGNTGPAFPQIHQIHILPELIQNNRLRLRFQDSDPTDGWGPNINWIKIIG